MKFKPITDINTALRIFYAYREIGNKQIRELFGSMGNQTLAKYKAIVREHQAETGIETVQMNTVNTKAAFLVWGIDVEDLERRRKKLQELGFC